MKALRAELTADGRLDILDKVMAYRGGMCELIVAAACLILIPHRLFTTCTLSLAICPVYIHVLASQDRRKIEKEAFSGNLLGIVATNALELGVDIGVLDAVIMLGFPIGGIASFVSPVPQAVTDSMSSRGI